MSFISRLREKNALQDQFDREVESLRERSERVEVIKPCAAGLSIFVYGGNLPKFFEDAMADVGKITRSIDAEGKLKPQFVLGVSKRETQSDEKPEQVITGQGAMVGEEPLKDRILKQKLLECGRFFSARNKSASPPGIALLFLCFNERLADFEIAAAMTRIRLLGLHHRVTIIDMKKITPVSDEPLPKPDIARLMDNKTFFQLVFRSAQKIREQFPAWYAKIGPPVGKQMRVLPLETSIATLASILYERGLHMLHAETGGDRKINLGSLRIAFELKSLPPLEVPHDIEVLEELYHQAALAVASELFRLAGDEKNRIQACTLAGGEDVVQSLIKQAANSATTTTEEP